MSPSARTVPSSSVTNSRGMTVAQLLGFSGQDVGRRIGENTDHKYNTLRGSWPKNDQFIRKVVEIYQMQREKVNCLRQKFLRIFAKQLRGTSGGGCESTMSADAGGAVREEKQETAAFWKTFGLAALLWAALAAGSELLFPSSAAAPAGCSQASCAAVWCCRWQEELVFRGAALRVLLRPLGRMRPSWGRRCRLQRCTSLRASARAGDGDISAGQQTGQESSARHPAAYPEQWGRAGPLPGRRGTP